MHQPYLYSVLLLGTAALPPHYRTVNSLIIENSSPIENGDFERFLAFRLARIGIFL